MTIPFRPAGSFLFIRSIRLKSQNTAASSIQKDVPPNTTHIHPPDSSFLNHFGVQNQPETRVAQKDPPFAPPPVDLFSPPPVYLHCSALRRALSAPTRIQRRLRAPSHRLRRRTRANRGAEDAPSDTHLPGQRSEFAEKRSCAPFRDGV